ncbi:MAG: CBS domain-containing protein [Thaumarchaeota archaeon]|nr:CBS domain-containing protein [Nitrososphaerota archaeon]
MTDEPKVADIMEKKVVTIDLDKNAQDAANEMTKKDVDSLVVMKEEAAVGIITEKDLISKVIADGLDPKKVVVRDVMSTPLITIRPQATVRQAAELMVEYEIRRVLVSDGTGGISGIVTAGDLAKTVAKQRSFSEETVSAVSQLEVSPSRGPYQ